ncbi:MAG TPA: hypothetical protein DEO85_05705 [Maritimibacter sp.]|nr:hypothetical protein [Maritimibacter sp.]
MTRTCALVTGGADGIGWSICQTLAAQGYLCAVADIDGEKARARAMTLGLGHVALTVDLSDVRAARALPDRARRALGDLHLVVNNAGITDNAGRTIPDMDEAKFNAIVAVNLDSVAAICRSAAKVVGSTVRIVNLASGASFRPLPLRGPYSATKAGVVELTRALAQEWDGAPVVSAVAPGYIRTPLVEDLIANGRIDPEAVAKGIPRGRLGQSQDIANAVGFLTGDAGAVMNGQCLSVDGGVLAAAGAGYDHRDGQPVTDGPALVIGEGALATALSATLPGAQRVDVSAARFTSDAPVVMVIDVAAPAWSSPLAQLRKLEGARVATGATAPVLFLCEERAGSSAEQRALNQAIGMFARTRALEEAERGTRINALVVPQGDTDVVPLAAFLLSEAADYVQAQSIRLTAD